MFLRQRLPGPVGMRSGFVPVGCPGKSGLGTEVSYRLHVRARDGRWGLPNKDRYYRPDLAKILGMTEHQARYAVKMGRIPKGAGVDAWERPFWTEEEVDGLVG